MQVRMVFVSSCFERQSCPWRVRKCVCCILKQCIEMTKKQIVLVLMKSLRNHFVMIFFLFFIDNDVIVCDAINALQERILMHLKTYANTIHETLHCMCNYNAMQFSNTLITHTVCNEEEKEKRM